MLRQIVNKNNTPCTPPEFDRISDLQNSVDPDASLVEALKMRSATAFEDLVKQYGRRLLNVAMRITRNREDAEDAVQESFLKVFRNIDGFRACSKFTTWLTRITINQALMLIRGNTQKLVSSDESTEIEGRLRSPQTATCHRTPEQLYAQHEFEDAVLDLANVRKSSRTVMDLYINQDLSEVEISRALSLSSSAVKARLHRGRSDLRAARGRHFRATEIASAPKKMSLATGRRSNPLPDILPEAFWDPYNGKRKQRSSWTSASGLATGNPLTAQHSQSSCEVESCLPDHLDPQLLTQPTRASVGRSENCF